MTALVTGVSNPLLPNGTFVVELVIFTVVLAVLGWWVLPVLTRAMTARNQALARRVEDVDRAAAAARAACRARLELLARARVDSAGIRAEAADRGRRIIQAARADAATERQRAIQQARARIDADRQQAQLLLTQELDRWSIRLAEKILQQPLDPERLTGAGDGYGPSHRDGS